MTIICSGMMSRNDENVNPLTAEIFEAIICDLQGHSNHFLQVDIALTKRLDKIICSCSNCSIIKDEVTKLSQRLHDEIVHERMRDTTYITSKMKTLATEIADKSSKSERCLWNK